ncbi:hypothetical protein GGQ84_001607 [Desulfitispora alkaliphila]
MKKIILISLLIIAITSAAYYRIGTEASNIIDKKPSNHQLETVYKTAANYLEQGNIEDARRIILKENRRPVILDSILWKKTTDIGKLSISDWAFIAFPSEEFGWFYDGYYLETESGRMSLLVLFGPRDNSIVPIKMWVVDATNLFSGNQSYVEESNEFPNDTTFERLMNIRDVYYSYKVIESSYLRDRKVLNNSLDLYHPVVRALWDGSLYRKRIIPSHPTQDFTFADFSWQEQIYVPAELGEPIKVCPPIEEPPHEELSK